MHDLGGQYKLQGYLQELDESPERLWAQVFQKTSDDHDHRAMIIEDLINHFPNNFVMNLKDDFAICRTNPSVIDQ